MMLGRKKKTQQQVLARQPSRPDDASYAFRRSRTITGSATDTVRAATEERGHLRSPRLHEHSLRKHRRKLFAYLSLIVIFCFGLLYVILSYIGGSVTMSTHSNQATIVAISEQHYQPLVEQYFKEHPFEQFTFSINENTFRDFMRAHAPEVDSAMLAKADGFGAAELVLQLREPVVSWTIQGRQYFVDASGSAFERNYFAVPAVAVVDNSGVNTDLGIVTSTKLLHYIARVMTLVGTARPDSPIVSVDLPAGSTREVQFKLKDRDYVVKGNLDRDPAGQAMDITNAVNYIEAKGIDPAYLDVRVSSKAFYRDR